MFHDYNYNLYCFLFIKDLLLIVEMPLFETTIPINSK